MPRRPRPSRRPPEPDREFDFHGYTAARMREELELRWGRGEWYGLTNVRIIHGKGAVLGHELHRWAREKGVAFTLEEHGGATLLHPGRRAQTAPFPPFRPLNGLGRYIAEKTDDGRRTTDEVADSAEPSSVIRHPSDGPNTEHQTPNAAADLMAAEYARLGEEGEVETYRRKQGLLGPAEPVAEPTDDGRRMTDGGRASSGPSSVIRRPSSGEPEDLMAAEWERLGAEDPRVTRSRKGRTE